MHVDHNIQNKMGVLLIVSLLPLLINALSEPEAAFGMEDIHTLSRMKRAGACTTTADCVSGNVCSKWGWCQWTNIYGEDGPSQGSSAPGAGVAGQCVTSADCASRVPYCSKLGFCHGGRLPFDEVQLEIPDRDKTDPFPKQPQGYINNNPPKNNPIISENKTKSGGRSGGRRKPSKQQFSEVPRRQASGSRNKIQTGRKNTSGRKQGSVGGVGNRGTAGRGKPGKGGVCPGGSLDTCIEACVPVKKVRAYGACVKVCGKRC